MRWAINAQKKFTKYNSYLIEINRGFVFFYLKTIEKQSQEKYESRDLCLEKQIIVIVVVIVIVVDVKRILNNQYNQYFFQHNITFFAKHDIPK